MTFSVMENRDSGVADVEIDNQQCMDHVHVMHGYVFLDNLNYIRICIIYTTNKRTMFNSCLD